LSGSSADCAMSLTIVTRSAAADANVEFFIWSTAATVFQLFEQSEIC
jgi:predicted peroxiredoxin